MLCFRVFRNGQHLTTAGLSAFGVLHAILSWVRSPDDESRDVPELTLHVGGSEGREYREHLTWCDANIRAGDVLTVEVHEDLAADPPRERRVDAEVGLDEVARLQLRMKGLEAQLAEVNDELRERGAA